MRPWDRTREEGLLEELDVVIDVGCKYDPGVHIPLVPLFVAGVQV